MVARSIVRHAYVSPERKGEIGQRLRRLKGQVEGLERMLEDDRPCLDILTQVAAAQEALRGAGRLMVRNYLETCATAALKAGKAGQVYDELMDVVFKLVR